MTYFLVVREETWIELSEYCQFLSHKNVLIVYILITI